jgi:uncharacterized protein YprB with RNaseH-like and TPR domain
MQIDEQVFLKLVEETKKLAFFDIEATGLRGDYNSVLVVSIKPYGEKPYSLYVKQAGNDQKVVREAKQELEKYALWCGYYSKGFDLPMLNTRLLKWGAPPIEKRPHLDMYFSLKSNLLTARKSQGHLLSFLETPEEKMSVTPNAWSEIVGDPTGPHMKTMIKRCESDVEGLEALYNKTKHIIREIKR